MEELDRKSNPSNRPVAGMIVILFVSLFVGGWLYVDAVRGEMEMRIGAVSSQVDALKSELLGKTERAAGAKLFKAPWQDTAFEYPASWDKTVVTNLPGQARDSAVIASFTDDRHRYAGRFVCAPFDDLLWKAPKAATRSLGYSENNGKDLVAELVTDFSQKDFEPNPYTGEPDEYKEHVISVHGCRLYLNASLKPEEVKPIFESFRLME